VTDPETWPRSWTADAPEPRADVQVCLSRGQLLDGHARRMPDRGVDRGRSAVGSPWQRERSEVRRVATDRARDVLPSIQHVGHRAPNRAARQVDGTAELARRLVIRHQLWPVVRPARGQRVDEQRLRDKRTISSTVAPERWEVEIPEERVLTDAVAVAERRHPQVLAGIHVDGCHP
jgi:hypothetical protein